MKELLLIAVMCLCPFVLYAQKDVTTFLGIPIDGTKSEMVRKLKKKGFTISLYDKNILEGEFNGRNVEISIVTNRNKVWRIAVFDAYATDEINIKNRFNELCRQFKNNKKYSSFLSFADMIPDSVNVAYEITTNKKRYEASFCQVEDSTYLNSLRKIVENKVFSLPREEQKEIIAAEIEKFNKKSVWFTIGEYLGSYRILMYYDNGYNRANGEDL